MRSFADAGRVLGTLEERVMGVVWATSPLTVREVLDALGPQPRLAYTTVMTTLDRLHRKGFLARTKAGNAFLYRPAMSREEYDRRILEETVSRLLDGSAETALAAFVDVAGARGENLDRLERLIAAKRASAARGRKRQ